MRTWIYHESKHPRVINIEDLEAYEDGWTLDPIVNKKDFGIEPEDVQGIQVLGHTLKGITECLNGALNLREMKPGQLKEFAQKHYGKSIKGKKPTLIVQIENLIHGNTKRLH